ncbi:PREDICTED: protein maelstrom homolog isoform X1 [Lepidothrix coronata]|uniref:Protein maelstrom homolog n=1 Tax=Lepidothrix coronata TaxID=321398 RepID=A0A6J0II36_9PASS|nr:PREDICTED: protein maelstrom homolog isoform X1 [Lepidothrix coronata]
MSRRRGSVSPFFCFVRDQLPELRRRGLPVARVVDAIPHCRQAWASLTEEEKATYLEKARKWNGKNRSQKTEKETHNLGDPVPASLTKKIPSVTSLPDALAVSWNNDQAVVTDIFYFLDIYSHGKLPSQCELRFLPCEIGCVRYSLQDGITADFHHFIEPEAPPRGFRYHCQAAGAETHKIPISGFHLPRTCYAVVLQELLEFAQPARGVQPRFFCRSNDRFRISWCLGRMATVAGIESPVELFAVEDLIVELYLKKYLKEPSKTWVSRKLDVCLWDFSSNTRCKWHEENDIICCALASCKKIAYCISRSLANVYGVPLTAAHLPLGVSHCDQSTSTGIVKLDAGCQKMKAESSGYDRPFGAPGQDHEFVPSNRDSPCGVKTSLGVKEVSYREEELLHF